MMKNFREKYAYKFSLYLSVYFFSSQIIGSLITSFYGEKNNVTFLPLIFSTSFYCFIFALILRFLSSNSLKRWGDIWFLLFGFSIFLFLYHFDLIGLSTPLDLVYFSTGIWCFLSLLLSMKYLFELRKRENIIKE